MTMQLDMTEMRIIMVTIPIVETMPTLIFLRKIADRYTTHTSMYTHGMDHLGISTASIVQMLNTSHQAKDFLFI